MVIQMLAELPSSREDEKRDSMLPAKDDRANPRMGNHQLGAPDILYRLAHRNKIETFRILRAIVGIALLNDDLLMNPGSDLVDLPEEPIKPPVIVSNGHKDHISSQSAFQPGKMEKWNIGILGNEKLTQKSDSLSPYYLFFSQCSIIPLFVTI
jgi:hypothetical protein